MIADSTDVSERWDAQSASLSLCDSRSEDIGRGSSGIGPQVLISKDMQTTSLGHLTECSSQTWQVQTIEVVYPLIPSGTTIAGLAQEEP